MQVTGAVSWRREGLQYKKNEVYLDIVESVNVLMTAKGTVLRSDVAGRVLMKCFLSVCSRRFSPENITRNANLNFACGQGMPELKIGLNDRLTAEGSADGPPSTSSLAMAGSTNYGAGCVSVDALYLCLHDGPGVMIFFVRAQEEHRARRHHVPPVCGPDQVLGREDHYVCAARWRI